MYPVVYLWASDRNLFNKISNEVVVIGTVYPGVEKYLDDYFSSLENQTCQEFDVLIANDGLGDLESVFEENNLHCKSIDVKGTVSSNRRNIMRHAMEMGYQRLVFTDCDDMFEENRIEVVNELLDNAAIVVNDLDITDEKGINIEARYFLRRFSEAEVINEDTIRAGNIMGLSNTAVRVEALNDVPALTTGDSIAFDWYLWACIFHLGNEAHFTGKTSTKYRVYGSNTAGLPQVLNESNIRKGIEVKQQHYELMSQFDPAYSELHSNFNELSNKWVNSAWRNDYIGALKENAVDNHMWWENIRPPSEVGLT